jgi:hypothetical protein
MATTGLCEETFHHVGAAEILTAEAWAFLPWRRGWLWGRATAHMLKDLPVWTDVSMTISTLDGLHHRPASPLHEPDRRKI